MILVSLGYPHAGIIYHGTNANLKLLVLAYYYCTMCYFYVRCHNFELTYETWRELDRFEWY